MYRNLTEFNEGWTHLEKGLAKQIAHLLNPEEKFDTSPFDHVEMHETGDHFIVCYGTDGMTRGNRLFREVYYVSEDNIERVALGMGIQSGFSYAKREAFKHYKKVSK